MKKLLFISMLFIVSTVSTFANSLNSTQVTPHVTKTITRDKVTLAINLGKIESSESVDSKVIENLIISNLKDYTDELTCSVEVSAEVSIGVAKFNVKVSVSGPCSEIRKAGMDIANQVMNEIVKRLKEF